MKREDSRSGRVIFPSATDIREEGCMTRTRKRALTPVSLAARAPLGERGQRTGDSESDAKLREISERGSALRFPSLHKKEREAATPSSPPSPVWLRW